MFVYKLLKLNHLIKNHRIKFFGLWLLTLLNKRTLSVYFDPVLACNLRCRMCYFSDKEYTARLKGIMPKEDLDLYANALFKNALKLQIGCGAEPTLYKDILKIIQLGKQYKIPYISLTTNGNLLTQEKINDFSNAGLDEFTISLHGVTKESYEFFMDKGSHDKFLSNLLLISEEKKRNPKLKLRINYTFNKDNFLELENFFEVFKDVSIDILQLRPIQKIGNTEYHDFNLDSLHEAYIPLLEKIRSIAKERKVTLLSTHLLRSNPSSDQNYLVPYTYCYVSPKHCWKDNFNFREETFAQWSRRVHWKSGIFSAILRNKEVTDKDTGTEKLNYSVDIN